jgi:hypothetical protein
VSTQWRHASTASDIDHLTVSWLDVEVSKGADAGYDVAGFETQDIAGTDARRAILSERRRCDPHVESEEVFGLTVTGNRVVVAVAFHWIMCDKIEEVVVPPYSSEGFRNIEVAEANRIKDRNLELHIVPRGELEYLARIRALQDELLNEGGNVAVADHAEVILVLYARAGAPCAGDVDPNAIVLFINRVGREPPTDGSARRGAVDEIEAAIVL